MYGLSKDFAAGGLRIGCLYTRNKDLWKAISAMSQFTWVPVASELIATAVLEDDEWLDNFFATSQARLGERNRLVRRMLDDKGIKYNTACNAGFFMWVDLRPWLKIADYKDGKEAEKALAERLMEKKVFLTPGLEMFAEEPGMFRVIFSQEDDAIREGLKRVFEVLDV